MRRLWRFRTLVFAAWIAGTVAAAWYAVTTAGVRVGVAAGIAIGLLGFLLWLWSAAPKAAGVVVLLLASAAGLAYVHRDRFLRAWLEAEVRAALGAALGVPPAFDRVVVTEQRFLLQGLRARDITRLGPLRRVAAGEVAIEVSWPELYRALAGDRDARWLARFTLVRPHVELDFEPDAPSNHARPGPPRAPARWPPLPIITVQDGTVTMASSGDSDAPGTALLRRIEGELRPVAGGAASGRLTAQAAHLRWHGGNGAPPTALRLTDCRGHVTLGPGGVAVERLQEGRLERPLQGGVRVEWSASDRPGWRAASDLAWDEGRAGIDATLAGTEGEPLHLDAALRGFPLTALLDLLGARDFSAALAPDGTRIQADLAPDGAAGDVTLALRDVRWRDAVLAEVTATAQRGARSDAGPFAAAPDEPWRITLEARGPDGDPTRLSALGTATRDGALDLDVTHAVLADLARLRLWPDAEGRPRIAGRAELREGRLTGPLADWRLSGQMFVPDGRVADVAGIELSARLDTLGPRRFVASRVGVLRESSRRVPETNAPIPDTLRHGALRIEWEPRAQDPARRFSLTSNFQAELAALEDYVALPKWLGLSLRTDRRRDVIMDVTGGEFVLSLSGIAADEVRMGGDRVGRGWIGALEWRGGDVSAYVIEVELDDERGRLEGDWTATRRAAGPHGPAHWEVVVKRAEIGKPGRMLDLRDDAQVDVDDTGFRVHAAELLGANSSRVRWQGRLKGDALDFQGAINAFDIDIVAGILGLPHVRGIIDKGRVQVGGTLTDPVGSVSCSARGVAYGHVQDATLQLQADLRDGRLVIGRSDLRHPSGASVHIESASLPQPKDLTEGALAAWLTLLADPHLAFQAEARDLPLAWCQPYRPDAEPTKGTIASLSLALEPAAGGPVGEVAFALRDAVAQGFPCSGEGRVALTPQSLALAGEGARFACLDGHVRLAGSLPRPAGTDPEAWLARDGLALVLELAGIDVRALLPARDGTATALGAAPGAALLTDGRAGGRLSLTGSLGRVGLAGELDCADVAVGDVRQIAGRVALRTEQRSGPDGIEELLRVIEGRLSGLGLAVAAEGRLPLALGLALARDPDGRAALAPRDPAAALGTSDLHVRLSQGDLKSLLAAWEVQRKVPLASRQSPHVSGALSGEFTLTGSWASPGGQGRVGMSDCAIRGVEDASCEAALLWFGRAFEVRDVAFRTEKGELHGSLRVEWDVDTPPGGGRLVGGFETRRIDVGLLEAWAPGVLRRAEGTVGTPEAVHVSGTTGAPLLHGILRIDDVSLATRSPDLPRLDHLRGDVRLDGDAIVIDRDAPLRGRVGGGEATLWGRAALGADADERLDVRVAATGALLFAGREGLRVRATLEGRDPADAAEGLRVRVWQAPDPAGRPGQPAPVYADITGTVRVTSAQFSRDHDASPSRGNQPLDLAFEIPGIDRTTLDLALRTDRPFRVRNNIALLEFDIVDALRLTGPSTAPLVVGRVQARSDGKFRLPIPFGDQIITPREFEVRQLQIEFGTARPGQPKLTSTLVLQYRNWEITGRLDGVYFPITDLKQVQFQSNPPLSEEEITAILVLGAPLTDSAAMRNAAFALASKIGLDILNQILFRGEGGIGSELLSRLSFEASAGDTIGGSAIRAEFRVQPWLNLYGAREADGTYSGGVGVRYALPRGR